jgi:hypothetical protein
MASLDLLDRPDKLAIRFPQTLGRILAFMLAGAHTRKAAR